MKKLLVATTNPGKLAEIRSCLSDLPLELMDLKSAGITQKIEETGDTFEENAILKAKFYANISGLPAIADDGGFQIDALGGEPGVKSHRWIHKDREDTDEELIAYTIKRMSGLPLEKRGAELIVIVAFALPDDTVHITKGSIRGVVPYQASKTRVPGFPYRSLLYLPDLHKFYNSDELTAEENDAYNHRKRAIEELKPILQSWSLNE